MEPLKVRKHTSVAPRRMKRNDRETMKDESRVRTTIVPMSHPIASVMQRVTRNAASGDAGPSPNGRPHFSMTAIDMPANPIIDPMERSNSPAIISMHAPVAMIPSWAMMARLFLIPSGL